MNRKNPTHKLNTIIRTVGSTPWKTEDFKRPNHPDFMTSSELAKAKWSGVRQNEILREWEFWILGEIKARVTEAQAQQNPLILEKTHLELFHMRTENFGGFDKGNHK